MAEVKQSESQEVPPEPALPEPAQPVHPPDATSAPTSSDLTPEELEMLQQFRKNKRPESPTKKPKLEGQDLEWQDFLEALAAKDVELSDLDFGHFEDWPLYFILFYYIDPRIDDLFPIPHPVKTKFKLPNFDKDQVDYINSVYSITDRLLTDHLFTCRWYADNIGIYTRYQQKHILDQWKISFTDSPDIDPDRIINIPWDSLVATSALIALDFIDPDDIDYFPENLNDIGFKDKILIPFSQHECNFYYIAAQIGEFIQSSPIYRDIYFGMDTFTNNSLQPLSAVCTCFTDVAYWQLAHVSD
eukprot:s272_g35.t1